MELTDHIREKVQGALMLGLPKKELDEFVQTEMDKFFKGGKDGYGRESPSLFSKMLQEEIGARAKAALVKWMDTNFEKVWEGREYQFIGDMVKKFVPITLERIGASITSSALEMIHQQLSGR